MTPREHVDQVAEGENEEILLCDGFEDALMGIQQTFERGGIRFRALYSLKRCVEIMVADGSTYESALEYLDFNTLGAYVGKGTPSFFLDLALEDAG